MTYIELHDKVQALQTQSRKDQARLARARREWKMWKANTFGTPGAIAWAFSAGALWGAIRPETNGRQADSGAVAKAGKTRSVLRALNMIVMIARLVAGDARQASSAVPFRQ